MDESKFHALDGLVTEVDADGPPTPEQAEQQAREAQALDGAQQWATVAQGIGSLFSLIAPELRGVYTPDACQQWGQAMQPVAEKHGWNSPTNLPEFGLFMVSLGLGVPTFLVLRERIKELKRERQAAEPAPAPDAGGPGLAGAVDGQ